MNKYFRTLLAAVFAFASITFQPIAAQAAVPDNPTSVEGLVANASIYAGLVAPATGATGLNFTIEAVTTNSLIATAVASCSGSLANGGKYAPIPRCTITGLNNGTAYWLRGYTSNADGNSNSVMSGGSLTPTNAAKLIRAEVPCDNIGRSISPCSSSTSDTVIKLYGQNLQSCSAITATGGNGTLSPAIVVTPNLAGTEVTFTKPASVYGWATMDCVGTINSFLSSGVGVFSSGNLTYSQNTGQPGDQFTVNSAWNMFVNVSAVTLGGVSATFNVIDYRTMIVTVPSGLSAGAKDLSVTNISGAGSKSSVYTVTAPTVQVPGTPGKPTATAGDSQATVTAIAPSSGGSPDSYQVTATPGGATCTITSPATYCTVTGLTNGTAYTFVTTATNSAGTSAASTASASVTPNAPLASPGTPGKPTATAGDSQASIAVVAPVSGGLPASYTITASPGSATCTVVVPATSCTISGLSNGTSYTFSATATNASGTSSASASSTAVTPSAPTPSSPSVPYSPPVPPAQVDEVTLEKGPKSNSSRVRVKIRDTQSSSFTTDLKVKLVDFTGKVIKEIVVPVENSTQTVEFAVDLPYGDFNVEAVAANRYMTSQSVYSSADLVQKNFFEIKSPNRAPVLAGDVLGKPIYFAANSAKLTKAAKTALSELATAIKQSDSRVALTGFASKWNKSKTFEQSLATKRSFAVGNYLKSLGVTNWVYYAGYGALTSVDSLPSARKVELRIVK
jgi:outer membrane protein OmpA-like peptidoglycan-associated protein